MSIAAYAERVKSYLLDQGFEYAEPDAKGGTFAGGVLMDLGGGQRVAFLLPTANVVDTVASLRDYLDEVYPGGHTLDPKPVHDGDVLRIHVRLNQGELNFWPSGYTASGAA